MSSDAKGSEMKIPKYPKIDKNTGETVYLTAYGFRDQVLEMIKRVPSEVYMISIDFMKNCRKFDEQLSVAEKDGNWAEVSFSYKGKHFQVDPRLIGARSVPATVH
jgi:hypothetical protein